ncbi:hypothetical protein ACP70R_048424 [Stipagrostis hirtigluma subsp. patula]
MPVPLAVRPINNTKLYGQTKGQATQQTTVQDLFSENLRNRSAAKMSQKTSWPEVVGLPTEAAKQKILDDRSDVQVVLVPVGSVVTDDFHSKRVRVFFNKDGDVAEVPKIG